MKWQDLVDEKPSVEFRNRTFHAADAELAKLQSTSAPPIKWNELVGEKPSVKLFRRILLATETDLARNRTDRVPNWRTRLTFVGVTLAVLIGLVPAARLMRNRVRQESGEPMEIPLAAINPELYLNAELLTHLDILEDLDALESWNGKDV